MPVVGIHGLIKDAEQRKDLVDADEVALNITKEGYGKLKWNHFAFRFHLVLMSVICLNYCLHGSPFETISKHYYSIYITLVKKFDNGKMRYTLQLFCSLWF